MHVYKKPFTRLVEEGTYITSHEGELLNSKNEWHQARSWLKPQRKSSKEEQNCCKEEEKEKEEIPWEGEKMAGPRDSEIQGVPKKMVHSDF